MKLKPTTLISLAVVAGGLFAYASSFAIPAHAQSCGGGETWHHTYTVEANPFEPFTEAYSAWNSMYGQSAVIESSYEVARHDEGGLGDCGEPDLTNAPTAALIAVPMTVAAGESSDLTWTSMNATSCTAGSGWATGGATSGTYGVTPPQTSDYSVSCTNGTLTATAQTSVTVTEAEENGFPTVTLVANPASIATGASSTLSWTSANAFACTLNNGIGAVTPNTPGTRSVAPTLTTTYTISCFNGVGLASASAVVTVTGTASGPDLTASAIAQGSASLNEATTLSATISNIGTLAAGDGFSNLFQIDNNSDHASVYTTKADVSPNIAASGTDTSSVSYTFGSVGTWYVRACADNNAAMAGTITELDETNNCGAWTPITVSDGTTIPGASVSCNVSDTEVAIGEQVTYTAVPSGGAGAPYAWTDTPNTGDNLGSGTTVHRTYSSNGTYAMEVRATGAGSAGFCPNVTVGTAACPGAPSATISAAPDRVRAGSQSTITWSAQNVTGSCTISGPGVSQTVSATSCAVPQSSITATINAQSVYQISCTGASDTAVVNLLPLVEEF